jgi:acetylornithine deacetylase/succinyl-diaminopimelate desuccinylase-like protein
LRFARLATSGFEPKGRLVSVSVPDEETSGPRGTVALASKGIIERDAIGMLTMEPTSGVIWNANRGVVSMRVTVRGKPAHVGLHFKGVNAFRGALSVAEEFASLERKVSRRQTRHHVTPAAARNSILLMGGELSGGHNFNVVPDQVSFTLDRRTNPEEDFDLERERLLEIVRDAIHNGIRTEAEIFQEGRSGVTQSTTPLARALVAGIGEASGSRARFELCPGVLETRHYQAIGIPALAFGPGLLSVSHGPNEFVSIPKMVECAEAYALAAARLL